MEKKHSEATIKLFRRTRLIALTASALIFTGACMSSQSSDPNKPLPRKSREDSLTWAKHYISTMAHYAEVKIGKRFGPFTDFEDCVGQNDEVAHDGRYTLTYTAYADLPQEQHIPAVRKLRAALKKQGGVDVSSYEERPHSHEVILDGYHEKENFSLIADSVKPRNTLRLSVSTPCFLPPGAKQQKF
ncbi:hypothetical protein [Streptomyces lydicus]|uniref:Uncharacterized protein n=1 Tax=Streptomyces lydicus TaxID=47763 RepID=A0A1D7VUN3_9ACTN|nr:hypothetical protein [Streptomyces lydicus]AOP50460.1 hypothetical protein SL103_33125 [Streptomyces lydicus]